MADSPKSIARRKWGRFLPHQRANVDQVPLPFVNDMEVTYEQKRYSAGVVLEARAVAVSNKQWRAEVAAHVRLVCLACQRVWRGFLTPSAKAHAGFS
jgi:hypothetical protein